MMDVYEKIALLKDPNTIVLCEHCIDYLRSRGEQVIVLCEVENDIEESIVLVCEWCENDEIMDCEELQEVHYICRFL